MQNWKKKISAGFGLAAVAGIAGCGASQDFGGFSRSTGGDISPGYGSPLSSRADGKRQGVTLQGTYAKIETSFKLASLPGDPFDYEKVQVMVSLHRPDGSALDVPAFYDGADTWRMRFTPSQSGTYSVASIKLNGEIAHETALEPKQWEVKGDPQPGFIRVDRGDHSRFIFDSGARYYPLGHNQAWHSGKLPEIPEMFAKMHTAGENWSRVWMNHWDGKNLDWSADAKKPVKLGEVDLDAAKRWDSIVEAAGKNDIYFQLTLQHHGQYSRDVNPNWDENPYNVKNGGFLTNPEDFFTDTKARALTKRKLYYIIARYGYSPNIMAWELFNEVQFTDAGRSKQWDKIALWHREMALFIKQWDGYHHLVTTSAADGVALDSPIWQTVDYAQIHAYPPDLLTGLNGATAAQMKKLDKPVFIGEFGGGDNLRDTDGRSLHIGLWNSMMQSVSGAAQYWSWDEVENNNLYAQFDSASKFLTVSGLANQGGTTAVSLPVQTESRAALRFAPGGGFGSATQSEFVVGSSGIPSGIGQYPSFLQGDNHRNMTPQPLTLQVNYPKAGTFAVEVGQIAKLGAKLVVGVDGKTTAKDYPAAEKDYAPKEDAQQVQVVVPAGAHTLTVQNAGKDWLVIRQLILSDYAPALAANARMNGDFAAVWVYSRDGVTTSDKASSPVTGRLTLVGLKPGKYQATWWDTETGKAGEATDVTVGKDKSGLILTTPGITRDAALYITRAGTSPVKIGKIRLKNVKNLTAPAGRNAPPAPSGNAPAPGTPQ